MENEKRCKICGAKLEMDLLNDVDRCSNNSCVSSRDYPPDWGRSDKYKPDEQPTILGIDYAQGLCQECGQKLNVSTNCDYLYCANQGCTRFNEVIRGKEIKYDEPCIDAIVMAEGLGQELAQLFNREDIVSGKEYVDLIATLIDARIDLREAQMRPIVKLKKINVELSDSDNIKPGEYHLVKPDSPAFIPLTETIPGIVRPGDRFNHKGQTMHVVFEKEYIPGLRELKWDPIEYEPVKPGNPWDEKVKDAE